MTGRVRFALLAALLVVGLTSPALAQKPVKIGVLTPLSPPGDAAAGQFIARGAKPSIASASVEEALMLQWSPQEVMMIRPQPGNPDVAWISLYPFAAEYGFQKLMMGIKKLIITLLGVDLIAIPSVLRFLYAL